MESQEQFERIFSIGLTNAALDLFFNLILSLFSVTTSLLLASDMKQLYLNACLVKPSKSFLYAHSTDLFCFISTLDIM